jgi:hypothetical protein
LFIAALRQGFPLRLEWASTLALAGLIWLCC